MSDDAAFTQLRNLIAEICALPAQAIRLDAKVSAYALDSVKETELLCAIEDSFGIQVDDDEVRKVITVEDLLKYVQSQPKAAHG